MPSNFDFQSMKHNLSKGMDLQTESKKPTPAQVNAALAQRLSQKKDRNNAEQKKTEAERPLPPQPEDELEITNTAQIEGGKQVFRDTKKNRHGSQGAGKKQTAPDNTVTQIRDFPNSVLNVVTREFPDAKSKRSALAAYVIVHSSESVDLSDVPDDVRELISKYNGTDNSRMIAEQLDTILRHILTLMSVVSTFQVKSELADAYLLFDRLGFRREGAPSPGKANLLEAGMTDMIERLRTQAKTLQKDENIRKGRPIR